MTADVTALDRARTQGARALRAASALTASTADQLEAGSGLPSLRGDRIVEWSFCCARLADGPGTTLDLGADVGFLSLAAAQRGHAVVALDRLPAALDFEHSGVEAIRADILEEPLPGRRFDQIINCSSVEHVGLAGRYGSGDEPDGDIRAMGILRRLMVDTAHHLLTIPVGLDLVCPPFHRIYGEQRLPRLLEGYEVLEEQYWLKDAGVGIWRRTERSHALATHGSSRFYSLGLFLLRAAGE